MTTDNGIVVSDDVNLQPLLDSGACLQAFYDKDRFRLKPAGAEASIIPQSILSSISKWLETTSDSSFLWLRAHETISSHDQANPMSMIAAKLLNTVAKVRLSSGETLYFVSYFCRIRRQESLREGNPTKQAQETVALAYAILAQLLEIIRRVSASSPGLKLGDGLGISPEDILVLDGSMNTWEQAMELLEKATKAIPAGTLCVIDALHSLSLRETEKQLQQLAVILRSSQMKVLFTTSGRCTALTKEVARGEIKTVEHDLF